MSDMLENAKIRPAPNGKVYVVWDGQPICTPEGGLRYFEDADNAHEFLEECNLTKILIGPTRQ